MMPPPGSQSSQNDTLMRAGSSQPHITTMLPAVPTPYKGWHLYMNEGVCMSYMTDVFYGL